MTQGHPARRSPSDRRPKALTKVEHELTRIAKEEGRTEMRVEVLSFLEKQYMAPGVERGSVEGDAILKVVRELSDHLGSVNLG